MLNEINVSTVGASIGISPTENTRSAIKTIPLDPTLGRKFDSGKPEYGLLPPFALEEVVNVLTIGATKYAPDNWRYVPNAKIRYFNALQRHVWAWKRGELLDDEYATHHLAHAICCLLFLLEVDIENMKKD